MLLQIIPQAKTDPITTLTLHGTLRNALVFSRLTCRLFRHLSVLLAAAPPARRRFGGHINGARTVLAPQSISFGTGSGR